MPAAARLGGRLPAREVGQGSRRARDVVPGAEELAGRVPGAIDELLPGGLRHRDREARVARRDAHRVQVEVHLEPGIGLAPRHQLADGGGVRGDAGDAERQAVAGEDLGERFTDDGLDAAPAAHDRLRRVLARRSAAEVAIDEQDARVPETRVVERMHGARRRLLAVVLEGGGAQALEDDGAEKAGRDDAIGVDVVATDRDRRTAAADALGVFHDQAPSLSMSNSSRASVTSPAMAAAATMTGDMRSVRPVGEPWRPLKLRLEDDAQSWSPSSLSGFMARHIEQPASRNSKPASRKTRSQPRRTASSRTRWDPGTTSAFTCGATRRPPPWMWRTTSSRSDRRPLVHEPMKATSTLVPRMGRPGSRCM